MPLRHGVLVTSLAAALFSPFSRASAAPRVPDDFVVETFVSNLDEPLSMAPLRDGRWILVEQRTGKVRLFVNGHVASIDPMLVVPSLNSAGSERGLQGVAVDPGWPQRPYVYLLYNRTGGYLRLVRYTASGGVGDPNSESLTLATPLLLLDNITDATPNHNGGTLRFGPDGKLYASLGEDDDPCAAQDSTRLKGVILRLDVSRLPSGSGGPVPKALLIPSDNPLASPDSNARLVYAYGLRNPWRFQVDRSTGLLYVSDVGDATWEEIDRARAGDNLGWPFREGPATQTPGSCTEPGGPGHGRYAAPIFSVNHSTDVSALLCAGLYRVSPGGAYNWPGAYDGNLFYSDYSLGFLRRLTESGGVWSAAAAVPGQPSSSDWATGFTRIADFQIGPDGSLWWLSQFDAAGDARSGSFGRIRYSGPTVSVPGGVLTRVSLRGWPNPFGLETELRFSLAAAARVRLLVYDARGRQVRTLLDRTTPAGDTRVVWNGRDDRGRTAAPGIYFARLEGPGSPETLRLLLIR